jgi:hypothetical protein
MKIELRKVHYSKALSDETPAYSADVYVDGKKRGTAANHGTGGQDDIYPPSLRDELEAYAKTLPPMDSSDEPGLYPRDRMPWSADLVLAQALEDHLVAAELRRQLRTRTLFLRDGVLYQARQKYAVLNAVVLNCLPFERALELFKKYAEQAR